MATRQARVTAAFRRSPRILTSPCRWERYTDCRWASPSSGRNGPRPGCWVSRTTTSRPATKLAHRRLRWTCSTRGPSGHVMPGFRVLLPPLLQMNDPLLGLRGTQIGLVRGDQNRIGCFEGHGVVVGVEKMLLELDCQPG